MGKFFSYNMHLSPGDTSLCYLSTLQVLHLGFKSCTRFVVADTRATNHMLPDALAFNSYKQVTDLSVRMGNNSFVPVLGWGTAVFSLNDKRVLVRNTLHVPGLAIPLYSLVPIYISKDAVLSGRLKRASTSIFHPLSFLLTCPLTVILSTNLWAYLRLLQCFITLNCSVLPSSILRRL
jgi:hypothetical protein